MRRHKDLHFSILDWKLYPLMVYHAFRLSLPPYDVKPPDSIHIYTEYGNDRP